jgi:hypothetical protein
MLRRRLMNDLVFCKDCGFYGQEKPELTYKRHCMHKICFEDVVTPESINKVRRLDIVDLNSRNNCEYFLNNDDYIGTEEWYIDVYKSSSEAWVNRILKREELDKKRSEVELEKRGNILIGYKAASVIILISIAAVIAVDILFN